MKLLDDRSASAILHERGLIVTAGPSSGRIHFERETSPIRLQISPKSLEQVALVYVLLMSSVHSDDEQDFPGGILWLQDWNIWSPVPERVGMTLFDGLRGFKGFAVTTDDQPVMLYDAGELISLHAALTLVLMFQWDAHFVPNAGGFFVFASHEGYVDIHCRTDAHRDALEIRLTDGNWLNSK